MAHAMFQKQQRRPAGFTLVELLVVIVIIAILASLITVAAVGAMRRARETRIKVEVDQIAMAFDTYAQDTAGGDYPPNTMTDGASNFANPNTYNGTVRTDFLRHFKRAFPNSRENEALLESLIGINRTSANYVSNGGGPLTGGMTGAEALVFWMSRFSDDPKYPISGVGGPSYVLDSSTGLPNNEQDPIADRRWVIPLEIGRLTPRNDAGYFNEDDGRYLQYPDPRDPSNTVRRINLWRYHPPGSTQPFVYFDASRHQPGEGTFVYDPPLDGFASNMIFALKTTATTSGTPSLKFANDGKIQVLHCGIDDNWGNFSQIKADQNANGTLEPNEVTTNLSFPVGPFTGELADTVVNFSQSNLEDSQP